MTGVERLQHVLDVPAADGGLVRVAVQVVLPAAERLAASPTVFFCHPGGGMSKRYFDLGDDDDRRFSFAEAMALRGWITVAVDPPGIGENEPIEDGYRVGPDFLTIAFEGVVHAMQRELRAGFAGRAGLDSFVSIGVGHSMGSMVMVSVQARSSPFDAVIVMGAGPYGLAKHLPPILQDLAGHPERARAEIVGRMREAGLPPYVQMRASEQSRAMLGVGDPDGRVAIRAARTTLVAVSGFFVMIPQSWAPEAAALSVPLMLAFGDADICAEPRGVPIWFTGTDHITLVVLPETGHNHFAHASIDALTRRIGAWVPSLFDGAGAPPAAH